MSTRNKKITYGKVEVVDAELDPKNVKERITIFIDQDIVDAFRKRAKQGGAKYQTLMNQALRESSSKPTLEERIEKIEKKLKVV